MKKEYNFWKGVAYRAIRAFVAGFVATAATMTLTGATNWTDLTKTLYAIAISGCIGGLSALFMAVDKALRTK